MNEMTLEDIERRFTEGFYSADRDRDARDDIEWLIAEVKRLKDNCEMERLIGTSCGESHA
jgi:hypothetical protein